MVNLSSLSSTKDLKARFTAASRSLGTLCFSWKHRQGHADGGALVPPHNFPPYLEQRHKLLDSALGHHYRLGSAQQAQVTRLGNHNLGARVPHQSVQEESPRSGKNAVHVHRVALFLLQLGVAEASDVLLQGKNRGSKRLPL